MLCACGCGEDSGAETFVNRSHASRYARNGNRATPIQRGGTKARPAGGHLVPCPLCKTRKMRAGRDYCTKCRAPVTVDLRAIAHAVAPRDSYPVEVSSADRVLAGPTLEDTDRRRQLERGLVQVECPGCQGVAWREPPCWVNGVEVTVTRCRVCDKKPCAECGERPKRWGQQYCAECWRQRRENEMNATVTEQCKYCQGEIKRDPRRPNQVRVTCGSEKCVKAHRNWLSANPRHKQAGKKPAVSKTVLVYQGEEITLTRMATKKSSAATEVQGEGVQQAPPAAGLDKPSEDVQHPAPASGEHMAGPLGVDGPVLCGSPNNAGLPVVRYCPRCKMDQCAEGADKCPECKYEVDLVRSAPILRAIEAMEAVPREKWNAIMEVLDARHEARLAANRAEEMLAGLGVA